MAKTTRTRRRAASLKVDRQEVGERVRKFYKDDLSARSTDREARLQRYAKFRMWTEGKDWPWENASDIGLSDMQEKSLRVQDTLHNAVMSNTPPVNAVAAHKGDVDKEDTLDNLIWHQLFNDMPGENMIGDIADNFVNDGVFTVFIPWVHEKREAISTRVFDPIPEEVAPAEYFERLIRSTFTDTVSETSKAGGWDWTIRTSKETQSAQFYTREDGKVEMLVKRQTEMFNGPRPIVCNYDQTLHPNRAANLQIPGPSNPGGATHVIKIDYPSVDECRRLYKSGFYDLMTKDEFDELLNYDRSGADEEEEQQKDAFQGVDDLRVQHNARSHRGLTRLMCFDLYDLDGDGIDEDVIWWYLVEPKILVRARHLTEVYPADPPRRPFAEATLIPVPGRRIGISLLEQLEPLHDAMKTYLDQSVDAGTIANSPFGFYRPTGSMKPETIRLWPGELYPLADPQRDVSFPQLVNQTATAWGLNMTALMQQFEERLVVIGDLQLGRVPAGKSSAMRTASAQAMMTNQSEARPERILRRFFIGLCEMWNQVHTLNQYFLPENKEIKIVGVRQPHQDPYQTVTSRDQISGRFRFEFKANVFNSSKAMLQQAMQNLLMTYVNPLFIQLGMIDQQGAYRLARDYGKSWGQDPDRYIKEPVPGLMKPALLAEEAISTIMQSVLPDGNPAEFGGAIEHMEKLRTFVESDQFGLLTPNQVEIFKVYQMQVSGLVKAQIEQQRVVEAAGQFQRGGGGAGEGGRPPEQTPQVEGNPPISGGGELLDEALPSAGGGGVAVMPYDREAWDEILRQRQQQRVNGSRVGLERLQQAQVRMESLTGDADWDLFLSYVQAAIESTERQAVTALDRLRSPKTVSADEIWELKLALAGYEAAIRAWSSILELPNDIKKSGEQAEDLLSRMDDAG